MSHETTLQQALSDAKSGKLDAAIASVRRLVRVSPRDHDAAQVLGLLLLQAGQFEQALPLMERAVAAAPRAVQYRNNYANVLLQLKRYGEAQEQWLAAIAMEPAYARAWLGLATTRTFLRDTAGAIEAAKRGLTLRPGWPELTQTLVTAMEASGDLEGAIDRCFEFLDGAPSDSVMRSQLLLLLNYTSHPPAEIFQAHQTFGGVGMNVGESAEAVPAPTRSAADPARSLRIGVLSGDLRTHSVAFFVQPLLRHAPEWAQLHVFSTAATPDDPMTRQLRPLVSCWTEVGQLSDAALAQAIRQQGIDVLLELAGHTGGNRLSALSVAPGEGVASALPAAHGHSVAPVIVSAIGYPNTTGHPAVGWRVVDSITDPPGAEALCTERLLRIDPCFLCYAPPEDAPLPAMPDATQPFTFGSFNAASKISDETIALWAAAMAAVPASQLLLKTQSLADPAARQRLLARLTAGGIEASRIELVPATATIREHLQVYARIHLALDTFPYNGTTTTCEALWMGVPVLTLAGDRHASRVGASLLHAIGRADLVATGRDDFARRAAAIASDLQELAQQRAGLRDTMRHSPLLDGAAYAERFYAALRMCWRTWSESAR